MCTGQRSAAGGRGGDELTIGVKAYVLIQLPVLMLAAGAESGCSTCSTSSKERTGKASELGLRGSGAPGQFLYKLPRFLQWFTGALVSTISIT